MSLIAKVVLLGSTASLVGGVAPASNEGIVKSSGGLRVGAAATVRAEYRSNSDPESPKTKRPPHKGSTYKQNFNRTGILEDKAMKNSICRKRNWWAVSLLGAPVDGSSN